MVGCSRQLCLALRNWPSPAHPGWARKAFRSSHVQPCVSPESSIGYNPIRIININNHTLAYCIYLETRKCGLRPKLVIFWSHLNSKSSPCAGPCPGTLRCPLAIQPFRQQRHRCINCRAVVAELCERSWPDRVATCCHNRCIQSTAKLPCSAGRFQRQELSRMVGQRLNICLKSGRFWNLCTSVWSNSST